MWTFICIYFITAFAGIYSVNGRSYDLVFERLEKVFVDKTYVDPGTLRVTHVNRTHTVITGEIEVMQQVDDDVTVSLLTYEKPSGTEYRRSAALTVKNRPICTFLNNKDREIIKDFKKSTNLPEECPMSPGKYAVKNYVIDPDNYPPYIPTSSWRGDVFINKDDITWLHLQIFFRIDHRGF